VLCLVLKFVVLLSERQVATHRQGSFSFHLPILFFIRINLVAVDVVIHQIWNSDCCPLSISSSESESATLYWDNIPPASAYLSATSLRFVCFLLANILLLEACSSRWTYSVFL